MESTLGEKLATLYIRCDLAVGHVWIIFLIYLCLKSLRLNYLHLQMCLFLVKMTR